MQLAVAIELSKLIKIIIFDFEWILKLKPKQ